MVTGAGNEGNVESDLFLFISFTLLEKKFNFSRSIRRILNITTSVAKIAVNTKF